MITTTAPDLAADLATGWAGLAQSWLDQSRGLIDQLERSFATPAPRRDQGGRPEHDHHQHDHHEHDHHGCCHDRDRERHGCCRDSCDCCVPDADVVVHARAGERRVVPLRLHNRWRRERPVTIEVGPWHGCEGDTLAVRARPDREQLTLGPCESVIVRLLVDVPAGEASDTTDGEAAQVLPDVARCSSAYADVRLEGCARPLRVAVVVRPATCEPVDAGCDCGCCC